MPTWQKVIYGFANYLVKFISVDSKKLQFRSQEKSEAM